MTAIVSTSEAMLNAALYHGARATSCCASIASPASTPTSGSGSSRMPATWTTVEIATSPPFGNGTARNSVATAATKKSATARIMSGGTGCSSQTSPSQQASPETVIPRITRRAREGS